MAPTFEEGTVGGFFPSIAAVSLFAATTCFLALCILCKRKDGNGVPLPDGSLPDEAMELSTLGGSATSLHELNTTGSGSKDQRAASMHILFSLRKDDGTASSSSFIIIPPRELPRIPPAELLPPEQTYSNLNFPKRAQEVLYESVTAKAEGEEEPSPTTEKAVPRGKEKQRAGAEYACVLKGKKTTGQAEPDAGSTPTLQESAWTPETVPIEEMYSVVCKDKKKKEKKEKKKAKRCEGLGEERTTQGEKTQGNCLVEAGNQKSEGRAGHRFSSFPSPMIEPCYEPVSPESWMDIDRKQSAEPAYETVDTHWKMSRRKEKSNRNNQAENLYESIENMTFQFRNHNETSHFEI